MKTNGVKLFVGYTLAMFLCVAGLTGLARKTVKETPPAETEQVVETEPEIEEDLPVPDPPEADNTWAVMLINRDNPLPQDYCDNVATEIVYESVRSYSMDERVADYIKDMFDAAERDGIELVMVSGYRTVAYQEDNFNRSVQDRINSGMSEEEAVADATLEVAPPGASEHNSGLAADIMCDTMTNMDDDSFKDTEAYDWLRKHCADYGFIIRYPQGKEHITGYKFEPWHYRFVGVYYAKQIMEQGITLEELFKENNWVDENGIAVYHLPDSGEDKLDLISGEYTPEETAAEEEPEEVPADESSGEEFSDDPENADHMDE